MTREDRRRVIVAPLLIWAGLLVLLALTVAYAYWPGASIKTPVSMSIALAKALLIAVLFMQLKSAAGLVRVAALAGVIWASFLFLFTFADLLTR